MTLVLDRIGVTADGRALLDSISLRVETSDFVVLVGPNGAGKSTLLRASLGLLRLSTGEVRFDDAPLSRLSGRERAARAAWLPQRSAFHEPTQVLDFVCSARFRFDETLTQARAAAMRFLERVSVTGFADRDLATLSGGEQQRVAIASLLAQEAPLLLLDEPAAHLDPRQQLEMHALLTALWREGRGILCATHDLNLLAHALQPGEQSRVRVVGLSGGRLAFSCAYDSVELPAHLSRLFEVEMRVLEADGHRYFVGAP